MSQNYWKVVNTSISDLETSSQENEKVMKNSYFKPLLHSID